MGSDMLMDDVRRREVWTTDGNGSMDEGRRTVCSRHDGAIAHHITRCICRPGSVIAAFRRLRPSLHSGIHCCQQTSPDLLSACPRGLRTIQFHAAELSHPLCRSSCGSDHHALVVTSSHGIVSQWRLAIVDGLPELYVISRSRPAFPRLNVQTHRVAHVSCGVVVTRMAPSVTVTFTLHVYMSPL